MNTSGLGKTIFTKVEIEERIKTVADEINRDYKDTDLVVISILKGSIYFLGDLTRLLTMPLSLDFLSIGVQKGENGRSRVISFRKDLDIDIRGRHVLLVEDVIGTGLTLGYILQHLGSYEPLSLKICTLLDNQKKRLININVSYRCFDIPDIFVVGYGLDYKERFRNLPYIAMYQKE